MNNLKAQFLLDPEVAFLNHGSFGATPRPVLETYQRWQRALETEPVRFLAHDLPGHLSHARRRLGDYLQVSGDDLVYVPNSTFGVNVVARSLDLRPGDEVLTSDHEYGACMKAWQFYSRRRGFEIVTQNIPLSAPAPDAVVDQFWAGVTERTRVIFLSHITSPTARRLPVAAICARARAAGILTLVDGAHAPGQIPLDLVATGADFYTGNAHKWLCSPKGAGFLYARPEVQHLVAPLIVGWGWEADPAFTTGSTFRDNLEWLGTNDLSAYLSVPAAIDFQAEHNWPAVRRRCHAMLPDALAAVEAVTGLATVYPAGSAAYHQMAVARLPAGIDPLHLHTTLYNQFRIEIPCYNWAGQNLIRLSIQGYNDAQDIARLIAALQALLPG